LFLAASVTLLAASFATQAADPVASEPNPPDDDPRQLVSMPAPAQKLLRQDMIDHLVVLNQVFSHLAAGEYQQAGELAEARLGNSSMGRHRGTGMGPGRFMPPEMHQLGIAMHQSASELAKTLNEQDDAKAHAGLQRVTSFCVACHMGFRIR